VLHFLDLHLRILRRRRHLSPSSPLITSSFSNGQRIFHSKYHLHLFTIDSSCLPSHPCSMSGSAFHTQRTRGQGRRAVRPERTIELVDVTSRYSSSDGEGPTRNGSCVRCIFHVLKPTPPLPTQPSVSATLSAQMTMASGSITTTPATPTKGGSTPKNCIGSIKN
jgi:hypothetical protein